MGAAFQVSWAADHRRPGKCGRELDPRTQIVASSIVVHALQFHESERQYAWLALLWVENRRPRVPAPAQVGRGRTHSWRPNLMKTIRHHVQIFRKGFKDIVWRCPECRIVHPFPWNLALSLLEEVSFNANR